MSEFEKSELEGRAYFDALFPNYIKDYSTEKYSWWDVSGYTVSNEIADVPYVAEIKKRGCEHDYYDTIMLQVDKYENLKSYTRKSGIPTFYICFFTDKTLVYNIDKLDCNKILKDSMVLPISTAEDNGVKQKKVMYLPISDAKILSRGYKQLRKN